MRHILTVFLGLAVALLFGCSESSKTQVVPKVTQVLLNIRESNPPALNLQVFGEIKSGLHSEAKLSRAIHKNIPSHGIQDYTLSARYSSRPNDQLVSELFAEDVWENYEEEAPWLKGIRIKGEGEGEKIVWVKADVILKNGITAGEADVGQVVEIQLHYPTAEREGPTVEAKSSSETFQHSVFLSGVTSEGKPVLGVGLISVRFLVEAEGEQNVTVSYKRGEEKKTINVKINAKNASGK